MDMQNTTNDITLSCRVRLARNILGLPFVSKLPKEKASENVNKVYNALKNFSLGGQAGGSQECNNFLLYRMSDMDLLDTKVLQEKRLISEDLALNKASGAAIIDESEQVSIMVNEEDHLRLQSFESGLDLYKAYHRLSKIDAYLGKVIGYSVSPRLGHLTSCVTNVGTGMRAGALLFLPGLGMSRTIEKTISLASNFQISIRGFFGEGSENDGYFYQISNQRTLGLTEKEILDSVTSVIAHLVQAEQSARHGIYSANQVVLKDKVLRAYGIVTNAYCLSSKELMEYLALVKLGHSLDILRLDDVKKLDKLIEECQPAQITAIGDGLYDPIERDVYRARLVAKSIKRVG
ncbi:MAG: hypothetical protein FWD76_04365 [Firmicutes bacterium]|nr:hypothetical protein [Bacillota bacterium]